MYSASSISKHLILVPILVVVATQLLLMRSVSSLNMTNAYVHHRCLANYGKYKPRSQYQKNLDEIIHSFLHNKDDYYNGYATVGLGMTPDHVSVTFQCRGDSYGPKCRSCFSTAQYELKKRCPRDKTGIIWYDQCLVEFSSVDTFGKISYHDAVCVPSAKNSSDHFDTDMLRLVENLTAVAVTEKKMDLYAAGEKKYPKNRFQKKKVYAMVQCIKQLSVNDCLACLRYIFKEVDACNSNKQGAKVYLGKICNVRFDLYPFVNSKTNYYKF